MYIHDSGVMLPNLRAAQRLTQPHFHSLTLSNSNPIDEISSEVFNIVA